MENKDDLKNRTNKENNTFLKKFIGNWISEKITNNSYPFFTKFQQINITTDSLKFKLNNEIYEVDLNTTNHDSRLFYFLKNDVIIYLLILMNFFT